MRSLLLYIFTCLLIVQPIYSTKNAQLYSSTNNSAFSLTYYAGETQGNIPLAEGSNIMDALSNITPTSCDPTSTTFVGWTDTHIPEKSNETPQLLSSSATMPASNYTVYAVFAKEISPQTTLAEINWNNQTKVMEWGQSNTEKTDTDGIMFDKAGDYISYNKRTNANIHNLELEISAGTEGENSSSTLNIYIYDEKKDNINESCVFTPNSTITTTDHYQNQNTIHRFTISSIISISQVWIFKNKSDNIPIYVKYCKLFVPATYTDYITFSTPELPLQIIEWKTDSYVIMYNGNPNQTITTSIQETTQTCTLSHHTKDIAVYEIPFPGLSSLSNKSLTIQIAETQKKIKIPTLVTCETTDTELSNNQQNIEELVILNQGALTITNDLICQDITIYAGGQIIIPNNSSLTTNNLTMRIGAIQDDKLIQRTPALSIAGTLTITTNQINLDLLTTIDYYYSFALPGSVQTTDIHYPTDIYGANVSSNNTGSFQIKYYDGKERAASGQGWTIFDETIYNTLNHSSGYAFWGIPKKVSVEGKEPARQKFALHRLPLKNITSLPTGQITVNVGNFGADTASNLNDVGWNYLGNPYYSTMGAPSDPNNLLQLGLYEQELDASGNWTGNWNFTNEGIRYITQTFDCQNYFSLPTEKASIPPFSAFFIQAAKSGQLLFHNPTTPLAQLPAKQVSQTLEKEIGIIISSNSIQDYTGWLIADKYTEVYDINADLDKFQNQDLAIYSITPIGKLAYMATNQSILEESINIGYSVSQSGDYMIAFDQEHYNTDNLQALYIIDKDKNRSTNLLTSDYIFTTESGTFDNRFKLQIVFKSSISTALEEQFSKNVRIYTEEGTIQFSHLPYNSHIRIYNAIGQLIKSSLSQNTCQSISLPSGYYIVYIYNPNNPNIFNTIIQ